MSEISEIEKNIEELTRHADAAQRAGDYKAMEQYDRLLEQWKAEKMRLFKETYSEDSEPEKPKSR